MATLWYLVKSWQKNTKKILYSQYGTIDCQSVLLVYIDEIGWVTFFFCWQISLVLADAWWSPHSHPVPTSHPHMSDSGWGPASAVTVKVKKVSLFSFTKHLRLRTMCVLYWCCQHELKPLSHHLISCLNGKKSSWVGSTLQV